MSPCFLCFFVIPLWLFVNKCGNRSSSPLQCSEPPDLHNSHFHICIFLLPDYFSFLWQTLSIPEQMDHTCKLFRFLLRFLPKTNSFTHVINTEVRNAEFNFNAKAFRRSLKNERIDCYFESFFVQDIPDEVFDLYCWIHSTYTIPRALRSLYILVISSATGTEGKTYRQVTTSFFQHPPNIDKDNPKCYAMNIVRTSFPS